MNLPVPSTSRTAAMPQAIVLIACTVLPLMGIVSLAPVLPALMAAFSSDPRNAYLVPVALTIPGLCIALCSTPFGVLADRWGRKRLLLAGLVLYAGCGVLPLWLDSLLTIIASRIGLGVAEAILMTTTTALVGDYFSGAERQKWIAFQAAVGALAASVLFAAGGALGQAGWRAPFLLYLLALPVAWAAARLLWEPASPGTPADRRPAAAMPFPKRAFSGVCAFTLVAALSFYVTPIHLGRVLAEVGVVEPARIGLATGLGSLGVPLGALVFKRMGQRPLWQALTLAMLLIGAPLLLMPLATSQPAVTALFAVNQVGSGILLPATIGWSLSHLEFAWRGRGSGLWNSTFFIGQFCTPLLFTATVTGLGSSMADAMAAFGVLGIVTAAVIGVLRVQGGRADLPPGATRPAGPDGAGPVGRPEPGTAA